MAKFTYNDQEKKTLKKMFLNSGLVFCGFNQVKMEANAFTCTMAPAIEELYDDPKEKGEALRRANGFFNTHAVMFSFIAGLTYALEKEKKTKELNTNILRMYINKKQKKNKKKIKKEKKN